MLSYIDNNNTPIYLGAETKKLCYPFNLFYLTKESRRGIGLNFRKNFIVIHFLEVPQKETKLFRQDWEEVAKKLKKSSGLNYINLHKVVGKSPEWLIYASWKSQKDCEQARETEEYRYFIDDWGSKESLPIYQVIETTYNSKPNIINFFQKQPLDKVILILAWLGAIVFAVIVLALRN
ncbi:antibiotic biosynthesis monooxygenase family protein [Floridanema aerugineum]|uniref:Antibiotic biosynthesis monooxygenase n=1 Tax=Floridaenema aerugineum BLCC-F46 TaxID=3153654 RepID=A0ABV4X6Y8_9CYAN